MPKQKTSISERIVHLFTYHPWFKLISLILAVILWFYVRGEIIKYNF